MKNKDFSKLVESIKEAGQIKAGRKKPSRVYKIIHPGIKAVREQLRVSRRMHAA